MTKSITWGIIGTGAIARIFARGIAESRTGTLVAVGSRNQKSAELFGEEFRVPRRYGSYEALLADAEVHAVYISTPHPMHAEWSIKAAESGKHVLCEKPLTVNHAESMAVIEAARANNVFLMEGFMYRCHPQTAKLVELIREKVIGDVCVIQATFSFRSAFSLEGRLLNNALGGGGILDVGCYPVSMARLIAGVALGRDFAEPIEVKGCGHIGSISRVDEWATASLRFSNGIVAQLAAGIQVNQENVVRIFGTEGRILIPSPWSPSRDGGTSTIVVQRNDRHEPMDVLIETSESLYAIEADTVAEHIPRREPSPPAMTWDDTLGNMKTLDRWREAIGMVYDAEKPENYTFTVSRRPLSVRADHRMKYGTIDGVNIPVSRLIMGADNQTSMPHAAIMFDDYFERGGNCFDTAFVYYNGLCQEILGQWVRNRGIRKRVVIFDKGAHTPFCYPEHLTEQLMQSLERLQTEYIDIYMLHRDNPEVPVGEFIAVLNEHKRAGRIHAFGGSNWTIERIEAANDYAQSHGLTGFSAVSNNFSLARMVQPVWLGSVSSNDPTSREWFRKNRLPLLAWSSQARGFFTVRASPDDRSNAELVRSWYSEENFRRLERARELAKRMNVQPVCIALAYVLRQAFPIFAIIGPRTLAETRSSFQALEIELTPEDMRWLDLED